MREIYILLVATIDQQKTIIVFIWIVDIDFLALKLNEQRLILDKNDTGVNEFRTI